MIPVPSQLSSAQANKLILAHADLEQEEESHLVWALKTKTASDQARIEAESGLLWTNLKPFLRLLRTKHPILLHYATFCVASLLHADHYRRLLETDEKEEEALERLSLFRYHPSQKIAKLTEVAGWKMASLRLMCEVTLQLSKPIQDRKR